MYNGPIIRPNPAKINIDRRKKICILIFMDEMESYSSRLSTRGGG
jgi:hypothetical protein